MDSLFVSVDYTSRPTPRMETLSFSRLAGSISTRGRRSLPTFMPATFMAVLTGMGFVSMKSLSKKSARRKYSAAAALKSPARPSSQPEGKSYASEIAQKYGVTYEMLVK